MTDTLAEQLGRLRTEIPAQEKQVAKRDAALRLIDNPDFKELIEEDYMKEEVLRNLTISTDPALDPQQREDALLMARGGTMLKSYLRAQVGMGNVAEKNIADIHEMIRDIEAEIDAEAKEAN